MKTTNNTHELMLKELGEENFEEDISQDDTTQNILWRSREARTQEIHSYTVNFKGAKGSFLRSSMWGQYLVQGYLTTFSLQGQLPNH